MRTTTENRILAEDLVRTFAGIIDTESTSLVGPDDGLEMERIAVQCAKECAERIMEATRGADGRDWPGVVLEIDDMYGYLEKQQYPQASGNIDAEIDQDLTN